MSIRDENGLTIKQEKYVQGLFKGLTQREAYKQAYDCENMTDKTIDEAACRAAGDYKVVARLKELTDKAVDRNQVTVERILKEYAKIGYADMKDFLKYGTEKTQIGTDDEGNPVFDYRQVVVAKPSDEVDGSLISEVSINKDGTFKFKLIDKHPALEKMGKHLKMFTDIVEVKDDRDHAMSTAELERRMLEISGGEKK